MVTAVAEQAQQRSLSNADIRSALYGTDDEARHQAERTALDAFLKIGSPRTNKSPHDRSISAEHLNDALESLNWLTPTEQLGFLVLLRARISSNMKKMEAASDVSAEINSNNASSCCDRHLS